MLTLLLSSALVLNSYISSIFFQANPYGQNYADGGGGSGGGGGGFMSQGSGGDGGGTVNRDIQNSLRPITVRQMANATSEHDDATFFLDGNELGPVTIVGVVREAKENQTNVNYQIEDGTGTMHCQQWVDSSGEDTSSRIQENTYVRVVGSLKSFQGKRQLKMATIQKIEDHNEVFFHRLDVIYTHLRLTGAGGGGGEVGGGGGGGGTGRFARPSDFSTWSNCAKELWNLCAQQVGEDGTDLRGAVSKLGNKYSFAEIKQAAEMIQDNGLGFETQEDFMSLTL